MQVKNIRMIGYKRFHDLTIDLGNTPKRIVALVGPNGCGKSSVFDAMIFYATNYSGAIGSASNMRDFRYHSLRQEPDYSYSKIEILFQEGTYAEVCKIMSEKGQTRSIFSFRSSYRYNSTLHVTETRSVSEILNNNYGASTASDIDQRIEEGYRRLLAKRNRYLKEKDVRFNEANAHVIGELNAALANCLDLKIDDIGDVESNRGTFYFKKSDSNIIFDYNVLSAGEKEVVDILLDLYLRKDTLTDSIYIIDEPELHLNTSIQRSLLVEINRIVPSNCQIWIAAHSIGFLRALQEELKDNSQIIEFPAENKWASQAYKLTPVVKSRATWQNLFSTALDDISTLVCPRTIIYCEGRAEPRADGSERGLDALVFNSVFSLKYPDILFISSGGNTELDQRSDIAITVLSKVFTTVNIWVLKDRDMASGRIVNEETRQLYLQNNLGHHRVLRRYEIENYLYDKEVLKAYCDKYTRADCQLQFDEPFYDSIVTDIVNQNLKDVTGKIKKCCGINVSISPDTFKKNLADCILDSMNVYHELEREIFERA